MDSKFKPDNYYYFFGYINNEEIYNHFILRLPYKGWENYDYIPERKMISFRKADDYDKKIIKCGTGDNWLEETWNRMKQSIDDLENEVVESDYQTLELENETLKKALKFAAEEYLIARNYLYSDLDITNTVERFMERKCKR